MNASRTARQRVRAELTGEINQTARRQLATEGAAALSLRAVARELGMVSSAVYRYFPSRDDLLTALIIDAYDAVGAAVERADARRRRDDVRPLAGRARAVRDWALAHPHEYALIYGSPVPGYAAPEHVEPASRVAAVLVTMVRDAQAGGLLDPPGLCPPPPGSCTRTRPAGGAPSCRDPDDVAARARDLGEVFGMVSFELFGQFEKVVETAASTSSTR